MKRFVGAVVLVGVVLAAFFLWPRDEVETAESSTHEEASAAANEGMPIERKPSAWLSVAPSRGSLRVEGIVENAEGPVANATVTATAAHGADVLSDLDCHCDNHCGLKLLGCGCAEAAGQLVELVATRTGESPPLARATTGADGRFVLTGLPDEVLALWADSESGIALDNAVSPGNTAVKLTMAEGRVITGTVVGTARKPVAGALVTAIFARQSRFFDVVADAKGHFRIGPIPAGGYALVATAESLLPHHSRVSEEDDDEVELTLSVPRLLSGVVIQDGVPVAGAEVKLSGQHRKRKVITDAKGLFRFERLRAGAYELSASTKLAAGTLTAKVSPAEDFTTAKIELGSAAAWSGVVVDEAGRPVETATVSVMRSAGGGDWVSAKSDAAGHFELPSVPSGDYRVYVRAHGFLDLERSGEKISEQGSAVRLVITRAASISGEVVDAKGVGVNGASVYGTTETPGLPRPELVTSGDGGVFEMFAAPGAYTLSIRAEGYLPLQTALSAPSSGNRLTLNEGDRKSVV